MRARRWHLWIGSALFVTGAIALGWCVWVWHEAAVAQSQAKRWLRQQRPAHATASPDVMTRGHAAAPRALIPKLHRGDVVAELDIPRLRVSVVVFEGDDAGILKIGAGHIVGTGLPLQGGNIGIAAHRDTFFRPLRFIRRGDVISLKARAGTSRFAVRDIEIVSPTDTKILAAAPGRDLTLVTCYPFFYVGSAPERFIVHAQRIAA